MLMYHCDGKGCDFASTNKDDFVHIKIGDPSTNELSAKLATRDLCPGCANRLVAMMLSQTVAPADEDAIAKEQIKEPCSGSCDHCTCANEDDYTEKTVKALKECGEKVANKLRATQQLAASVVGERMLNYLMQHSENGKRKVKYYGHMTAKSLATLSHEYGCVDVNVICAKYAVTPEFLMHPDSSFCEVYALFKTDIVNTYIDGLTVEEIARDLGVSDRCIMKLLRAECPEEFWRRDVHPDAPLYNHSKNLDIDLVLSMYGSGATILAIKDFTGYTVADIVGIMNSTM